MLMMMMMMERCTHKPLSFWSSLESGIIHWHKSTKKADDNIFFAPYSHHYHYTFANHARECVAAGGETLDDSFLTFLARYNMNLKHYKLEQRLPIHDELVACGKYCYG
jgi:hypothetical protein